MAFKEAGIKVWMLTGDKVETAINIGYSAGLLNSQMNQVVINVTSRGVIERLLREMIHKNTNRDSCVDKK